MLTYFSSFECRGAGPHNVEYLQPARTTEAIKLKLKSHRWHKTAIAAAATSLICLWAPNAVALSLGSITVQSALGEPLRAEIDVPDINAEEASSLKASVASPEAFRAAGLDYNPAMSGLRVSLQRRADGRAYIRLSSDKPVNEPFIDMILEANWSSGRIVRDFTMLFDPPNLRAGSVPAATPAQITAAPSGTPSAPTSSPVAGNAAVPTPMRPAAAAPKKAAATSAAPAMPKAVAKIPAKSSADGQATAGERQVAVKPGDTASKIAVAVKPASVSLDQMLVALLRANPDAFINSNINRIKSGALLNVPTPEQAQAISTGEASRTVIAQSRDFNDFRKKLAGIAPSAQIAAPDRQSSGSVQAKVDDKKTGAGAPDKLTLSKGAIQAQADTDKIAKERAAREAATKTAELSKNIAELGKIGAASSPALTAPPVTASPVTATTPPSTNPNPAATTPAPSPAAVTVAPTGAASSPVVVQTPAPPKRDAPPPPMPVAEPGFIGQLLENPWVPTGAAALIAALAGFGFYRSRQKKKALQEDSAFLESRLQPDSFFGASGGQRVDTNDGAQTGSSMVYSPSQLDAADDVDPVAEADVYLAYGRDLQAEEILKEASRINPGRVAIQQKLLEIYAKRRDIKTFENVANDAYKITGGEGPDWQRVCELGLGIDPTNPLYLPGGEPTGAGALSQPAPLGFAGSTATGTVPLALQSASAASADLDLDLDFSLDEENASVMSELRSTEKTARMDRVDTGPGLLDMNLSPPSTHGFAATDFSGGAANSNAVKFDLPELDHTLPSLPAFPGLGASPASSMPGGESEDFRHQAAVSFGSTSPIPLLPAASVAPAHNAHDTGMLEFDLGSLSLDLSDSTEGTSASTVATPTTEDPLAIKLSLAEEFSAIGDDDGARALIEEVISEASGEMKLRAQQALTRLS